MKQKRKATVNSKNKDSLFRIIFKDKKELLQLYNALAAIRRYLQEGMEKEAAVELAIDECIRKNILADILRKERAVVCDSVLTEFDEEEFAALMRKEGKEEGRVEGKIEGKTEAIVELLEELGEIPPDLQKTIRRETNPDTVRRWLKLAGKAESIEAFCRAADIKK